MVNAAPVVAVQAPPLPVVSSVTRLWPVVGMFQPSSGEVCRLLQLHPVVPFQSPSRYAPSCQRRLSWRQQRLVIFQITLPSKTSAPFPRGRGSGRGLHRPPELPGERSKDPVFRLAPAASPGCREDAAKRGSPQASWCASPQSLGKTAWGLCPQAVSREAAWVRPRRSRPAFQRYPRSRAWPSPSPAARSPDPPSDRRGSWRRGLAASTSAPRSSCR